MGRKFPPFHEKDINVQTSFYTKNYKSLFCLKCFNETQSTCLNIENLFRQANSSYGIPVSCFKTLSHLKTSHAEHCYLDRETSSQQLNLVKLTKYFRISEEQRKFWCRRSAQTINHRAIRVRSLGVTSSESYRLQQYRSKVLDLKLIDILSQKVTIIYNPSPENEQDEDEVRRRDALLPSRSNIWSRVRMRLWTQYQRAHRRHNVWVQTHLTTRIDEELLLQEMTSIHSETETARRDELFNLVNAQEDEILNDEYYPHLDDEQFPR